MIGLYCIIRVCMSTCRDAYDTVYRQKLVKSSNDSWWMMQWHHFVLWLQTYCFYVKTAALWFQFILLHSYVWIKLNSDVQWTNFENDRMLSGFVETGLRIPCTSVPSQKANAMQCHAKCWKIAANLSHFSINISWNEKWYVWLQISDLHGLRVHSGPLYLLR